jgi:hypothetical protein
MTERAEIYAHLELSSQEVDPDQITAQLSLQPSRSWRRGDRWREDRQREEHFWVLQTPTRFSPHLDEPLEELLGWLAPSADALKRLVSGPCETARICLVGYFHEANPGFYLNNATLETIAGWGLDLQLDLFLVEGPSAGEDPNSPE